MDDFLQILTNVLDKKSGSISDIKWGAEVGRLPPPAPFVESINGTSTQNSDLDVLLIVLSSQKPASLLLWFYLSLPLPPLPAQWWVTPMYMFFYCFAYISLRFLLFFPQQKEAPKALKMLLGSRRLLKRPLLSYTPWPRVKADPLLRSSLRYLLLRIPRPPLNKQSKLVMSDSLPPLGLTEWPRITSFPSTS